MIRHKLFQKSEKLTKWQVFKEKKLIFSFFGANNICKNILDQHFQKSLFGETHFKIETVPHAPGLVLDRTDRNRQWIFSRGSTQIQPHAKNC